MAATRSEYYCIVMLHDNIQGRNIVSKELEGLSIELNEARFPFDFFFFFLYIALFYSSLTRLNASRLKNELSYAETMFGVKFTAQFVGRRADRYRES